MYGIRSILISVQLPSVLVLHRCPFVFLDVRSPSAPHCLTYCPCNPLKSPFAVGRRPALNSLNYLCSQWYADPHLSDSTVTTTSCLFGDNGNTRGEGLPLRCTDPCCQSSLCTRRKSCNKGANCKLLLQFVGDYGIIIRSEAQHDVALHTVDLEFWAAHAGHGLSSPLVCKSWDVGTDAVVCQRQSNRVGKCTALAHVSIASTSLKHNNNLIII